MKVVTLKNKDCKTLGIYSQMGKKFTFVTQFSKIRQIFHPHHIYKKIFKSSIGQEYEKHFAKIQCPNFWIMWCGESWCLSNMTKNFELPCKGKFLHCQYWTIVETIDSEYYRIALIRLMIPVSKGKLSLSFSRSWYTIAPETAVSPKWKEMS